MLLLIGVFLLLSPLALMRPDRLVHPPVDPHERGAAEPRNFLSEGYRAIGFFMLLTSLSIGIMLILYGG
ncbi:hypothetical protein CDO73_10950 [Saccharibacillus sp. O23]|uniref:hypothetical protein n=1 Tax=Saccharibacillus sp. O23 TaxID=2009338 RepID=UPI000B4E3F46|nr:hypothetical protein [Saccharibacillus sp. O23]OWR30426.1 hypothetical protein CDO73_10950 [Saccharibacillus sp. O23]